jgi:integration host factor subunit beta
LTPKEPFTIGEAGEASVTKKEIVRQISERSQLTQLKVKEIVQWTFDAIIETLINDGRIELRNFGVFEVRKRKARRARNPRTDERVFVPEKNVVTFQPGKEMEESVRVNAKVYEPKRKKGKSASGNGGAKKPASSKTKPSAKPKPAPETEELNHTTTTPPPETTEPELVGVGNPAPEQTPEL